MADSNLNKTAAKVTAIVPAFNEAGRIEDVLQVLTTYKGFEEIIVIDDGSTDKTAAIAKRYAVRVLQNSTNVGKGRAMDRAVQAACGSIVFFSDADVRGLNHRLIDRVIEPVKRGETEMFIAMRNRNIYYLRLVLAFIPLLGGERALTKKLWQKVPVRYKRRFMIEAALNFYAKYYGQGFQYAVFRGLRQTIKEKKYGIWHGFVGRVRMFAEIIQAQLLLQFSDVPPTIRSGRAALMSALAAMGGVVVGAIVLVAAYSGPVQLVRTLFADELREDSAAPFVHLLLHFAGATSFQILFAVGLFITLANVFGLLMVLPKVRFMLKRSFPRERVDID